LKVEGRKGSVDAERPKKGLSPTQVAGEGTGIFASTGAAACLSSPFAADPQKIGGATRPRAALAHQLAHAR
jgi:hypothetical protein